VTNLCNFLAFRWPAWRLFTIVLVLAAVESCVVAAWFPIVMRSGFSLPTLAEMINYKKESAQVTLNTQKTVQILSSENDRLKLELSAEKARNHGLLEAIGIFKGKLVAEGAEGIRQLNELARNLADLSQQATTEDCDAVPQDTAITTGSTLSGADGQRVGPAHYPTADHEC
jgi:hypothetical protein